MTTSKITDIINDIIAIHVEIETVTDALIARGHDPVEIANALHYRAEAICPQDKLSIAGQDKS
jgi:hypothetical protein